MGAGCGVRVIDITNPATPREVAFWAGAGAPPDAPLVDIWGIALDGSLVLASDRNFGLYVLRLTPADPPRRLTGPAAPIAD